MAKITSEADQLLAAAPRTQTGLIMGTYLYMSPEQAGTNTKDIDTRSDVYSLGVLFFELLTGSTPIDRTRAIELIDLQILTAIREEEPPRPSDRLSKLQDSAVAISNNRQTDVRKLTSILRGELDWIALKALAKDRKQRYDGPKQLAEDLQRYLSGEAITARPPSVSYRLRKTLRKHSVAVGITTLALSLLTAGFIATCSQLQRAIVAEKLSSEIAAKEKEQRKTAETNLARATKAETENQQRVKELEALTKFQQSQFLSIDIQLMAMNLRRHLREEFRQSNQGSLETQRAQLDQSIADVNFVDISRVFLWQNVISPAISSVRKEYANQPKFQASIFTSLAATAHRIGLEEFSVALISEAVKIRREVLGNYDLDTLHSIGDMAVYLQLQGNWREAELLHREALTGSRMILGNEHPRTLSAINNLALLLNSLGNWSEAEILQREALETSRKTRGNDDLETLTIVNNMALINQSLGKIGEAEQLYREALDTSRRVLGNESPGTAKSILNMALFLANQGKWSEAEPLQREALDTSRKIIGSDHPETLTAIDCMASLLDRLGNWNEAEPLHCEALDSSRELLGNEHPTTLSAIESMASFLSDNGKLKEAEPLYREALNARRKLLGNGHHDTLTAIHNMAVCFDKMLKWSDAEPLYREALDGRRKLLGIEHQSTLMSISDFARSLHIRHKFDESENLYREFMDAPVSKPEAWRRGLIQLRLGKVLMQTKKNAEEAKHLIEDGYAIVTQEIEHIAPASRQKYLDEAASAMKWIEPTL